MVISFMNYPLSGWLLTSLLVTLGATACSRQPETVAVQRASTAQAAAAGAAVAVPSTAAELPKYGPAPAWKLQDINGQVVSSEQFKGKVVVIDFWATWCGPCRLEIPGYIELHRKYGAEGLVVIGVSLDQGGPEVVKAFAGKMGINYPLVMGDEPIQTAFGGLEAIPTTFVIDRTGQVRHRKVGAAEAAEYEKSVLAVLREKV